MSPLYGQVPERHTQTRVVTQRVLQQNVDVETKGFVSSRPETPKVLAPTDCDSCKAVVLQSTHFETANKNYFAKVCEVIAVAKVWFLQ